MGRFVTAIYSRVWVALGLNFFLVVTFQRIKTTKQNYYLLISYIIEVRSVRKGVIRSEAQGEAWGDVAARQGLRTDFAFSWIDQTNRILGWIRSEGPARGTSEVLVQCSQVLQLPQEVEEEWLTSAQGKSCILIYERLLHILTPFNFFSMPISLSPLVRPQLSVFRSSGDWMLSLPPSVPSVLHHLYPFLLSYKTWVRFFFPLFQRELTKLLSYIKVTLLMSKNQFYAPHTLF